MTTKLRVKGDWTSYQYEYGRQPPSSQVWNVSFSAKIHVHDKDKKRDYYLTRTPTMVVHSAQRPDKKRMYNKIRMGIKMTSEMGWEGSYNSLTKLKSIKLAAIDNITDTKALQDQLLTGVVLRHDFKDEWCERDIVQPEGECVASYLLQELRGRGIKRTMKLGMQSIKDGLAKHKGPDEQGDGYSVHHILQWLRTMKIRVSVYAIGAWGNIFVKDVKRIFFRYWCS